MIRRNISKFCLCSILFLNSMYSELYITYDTLAAGNYGGGAYFRQRMGNQLLALLRAYRIARARNATLVIMPLDVSVKKALEKRVKCIDYEDFYRIKRLKKVGNYSKYKEKGEPAVYDTCIKYKQPKFGEILTTKYRDEFRDVLIESCPDFEPIKSEKLTVAVHIRNGGGIDYPLYSTQFYDKESLKEKRITKKFPKRLSKPYLDKACPTKAPPLQFYVDSIEYFIENISSDVTFYVFTDHLDKTLLIEQLKEHLSFSVDIRAYEGIQEDELDRDLNDILVMSSMDGIIRPCQSTFSIIALYLGNFSYYMHPIHYLWYEDCLVMNRILARINGKETLLKFYEF